MDWNPTTPIFIQLRDRMVAMILDGGVLEGEALPSVRHVATDCGLNPLTVSKAYQELVDMQVVEKRRGLGMFVTAGAVAALRKQVRDEFLRDEWPGVRARIERMGLTARDLLGDCRAPSSEAPTG